MVHLVKRNKEKHLKVAGLAASAVISTTHSVLFATGRVVAMRDLHLLLLPIRHLVPSLLFLFGRINVTDCRGLLVYFSEIFVLPNVMVITSVFSFLM